MKSRFLTIVKPVLFVLAASLVCGLPATAFSSGYNSDELTTRIKSGGYLQKTDNLMIILDGTGKQGWLGRETPQVQIGKALIQNIGATIPNIPHRRMLRVFGPTADSFQEDFSTIFGLYDTYDNDYTPIIATKTHPISDNDPLELTFLSAMNDLKKIDYTHAVVLISRADRFSKSAMAEAAYLKKAFGGSICFYPIHIGNTPKSAEKMQQFARIGGCGIFSTYSDVDTPAEMTNFVETIFFAKKKTYMVAQPVTPVVEEPVAIEIIEAPYEPAPIIDVAERSDDLIILERQLPYDKTVTIELHVEFDLDKAIVKDEFATDIQNVADFMLQYPETEVLLEGYTCSLGSDEYNMILSNKRAEAVKNNLVNSFAIPAQRIKTRGAGEAEPIADNATEEGRIRNRRVMALISTTVTDYITIEQEIPREEFLRDDFVLPSIE
ncbi:MAG: OmpA family protein [Desulfobulbaceae bacterium]|jgi:outer membrane protein OmpA-like peptidoglycan-associated protein|nr:OmpA family protein [Desulfobulbaceae bacterium]